MIVTNTDNSRIKWMLLGDIFALIDFQFANDTIVKGLDPIEVTPMRQPTFMQMQLLTSSTFLIGHVKEMLVAKRMSTYIPRVSDPVDV